MDDLMKLTIAIFLIFSAVAFFGIVYYSLNYSEEWRRIEYQSYVDMMNRISSPIVFLAIVLIPICTLRKIRRNVAASSLVIAGVAFLLASFDYRFALAFSSTLSIALLTAYIRKNLPSTLIHAGIALFVLDFATFEGTTHLILFYLSSSLYLIGMVLRFHSFKFDLSGENA
ncbi:hypothetical protein Ferp_1391 [Ferroglobus placidus DSM 10642]|uniref:Uncharacterized protein n=1 Tax=Ferroglobus placidus (strain DSM 10642 / AEDII12DO) TaxID=589924 RepID=D3RYH9_FERPA|nr:hypothetical protein [Ferroglobus placidus]ADC65542.1 hypothetical protein Ferp_1391 [Ferroglobus placidus DSM 10642]